jgi:transposase
VERREVVDLLPDRAITTVAKWFSDHPEVELVSRDRAGVYADGARQGALQARQVADRFHLLMNFRETVAREMNGIGPPIRENSSSCEDHAYQEQGYAAREQIVALTRCADRRAILERRRAEGITNGRQLFGEFVARSYTASYSHLARFLSPRTDASVIVKKIAGLVSHQARDPASGRLISALTAAALCIKPRNQMTDREKDNLAALKTASATFASMRRLAMRFRGIFRGCDSSKLDLWLQDAEASGVYGMRRFGRALRLDIDAVRNAIDESWSNGQVEGQINRLKMLKRGMYGRASLPILRARMMPL